MTAWAIASLVLVFGAGAFSDNFESGALLDADGGRWSIRYPAPPGCAMGITSAAAHRGDAGFRFTNSGVTATGNVAGIASSAVPASDIYARFWVRITPTQDVQLVFSQTITTNGSTPSLLDTWARTDAGMDFGGFISDAGWVDQQGTQPLPAATWHLFELAVTGVGTANGRRRAWLDGQLATDLTLDYSTETLGSIVLGEAWTDSPGFVGTIDYDDVRWDAVPQASTLALLEGDAGAMPGCLELAFGLRDSVTGAPASAPYPLAAALLTFDAGNAFADPLCRVPTAAFSIDAGTTSGAVFWQAPSAGTFVVGAAHVDFLSQIAAVSLSDPGAVTRIDAGMDPTRPAFPVGCDCGVAPFGTCLLGLALLSFFRAKTRPGSG